MAETLLSYAEAAEEICRYIGQLPSPAVTEAVSLLDVAGRVLAQEIRADRDQPPFPRSTRDGFACRAADANTYQPLHVAGQVRAGEIASSKARPGEAWEIMTGAPVPDGLDAVFMVEHSERIGNTVRMREPRQIAEGENIVPAGAEARTGELVIPRGTRLEAQHIALAAQCGYPELTVFRMPVVAILSSGDELVAVAETPALSQIRNSNSPMLAALVASAGGQPLILPVVRDEEAAVDAALASAFHQHPDLLLLTGGISAGRFDFSRGGLERAGARILFAGVAMQPGKPVVVGEVPLPQSGRMVPFLALPGNPISSAATFHLFAAPVLAALGGNTAAVPRFAAAHYASEWRGKPGLTRFLPARCDFSLNPQVELVPWHGSGDLAAYARSNCLLVLPSDCEELHPGSEVSILLTA
ncbi:gephyrin-like molybdotransferase Glp [Acidicapsa dinghuensis]|uniref:Molybdopterin molybdenumtransferase n=1 Tax=Acidicapsa dinghuensis TaxID=2218256 RepID=A0ABW1EAE8_9BACT|nr:gephyrin-like molybdotransferase Glp [Acidicapsa dinghuensis]